MRIKICNNATAESHHQSVDMKHKIFLSLVAVLLTALSAQAYDFQSGDLYYEITSDSTVEVTYQEISSTTNYPGLSTIIIPETVTYDMMGNRRASL